MSDDGSEDEDDLEDAFILFSSEMLHKTYRHAKEGSVFTQRFSQVSVNIVRVSSLLHNVINVKQVSSISVSMNLPWYPSSF